jgi:hypothetical protein
MFVILDWTLAERRRMFPDSMVDMKLFMKRLQPALLSNHRSLTLIQLRLAEVLALASVMVYSSLALRVRELNLVLHVIGESILILISTLSTNLTIYTVKEVL